MKKFVTEIKRIAEENRDIFENLADYLWDNPELGLEEYKSSEAIIEIMKKNGFSIKSGISGMKTAFVATKGSGKPVIGISCEYDALPGLSQVACNPKKEEVKEKNIGHGCGHNLLGSGAVGAALVVAEYLERYNLSGTIKLFGSPSEERDGAKVFLGRDGIYNGVDFAVTWHPAFYNAIWDGGSLANIIVVYTFKGVSSHAAAAPELGRSALDSAELMNVGVNYLREHIVSNARVHYSYLDTGGKAPNVVQSTASLCYFIRSNKIKDAQEIYQRVNNVAKGAALMCGTEVEIDFKIAIADFVPNMVISKVLYDSIKEFGLPKFTEGDMKLAKNFYDSLSEEAQDSGKHLLIQQLGNKIANEVISKGLDTEMAPFDGKYGLPQVITSDVGDMSHYIPTAQMFIATAAIGTPLHSWQMCAQAKSKIAKKGLFAAVGGLSTAILTMIKNPELIEKANKEFQETVGKYETIVTDEIKPRNPEIEK